jgi:uncharacterized protein (TIGR02594 family)
MAVPERQRVPDQDLVAAAAQQLRQQPITLAAAAAQARSVTLSSTVQLLHIPMQLGQLAPQAPPGAVALLEAQVVTEELSSSNTTIHKEKRIMALATLVGGTSYRMGTQGEIVRQMQLALGKLGYPLHGTGYFGAATDTALTAFQKRAGLNADGVLGPMTAAAIDAATSGKVPAVTAAPRTEIARPLWLQAGLGLLGTKEGPGALDNPTILEWAKEEGGEIAKEYTHDAIPWCCLFANHCLTLAGLKGTGTLWALDFAGHWPSVKLTGPAVGAFAPMKRPGGGHIIQIVGKDQRGNVMGLGGNQADEVSIRPFPRARLNQGFWWPEGIPTPIVSGFDNLPVVQSDGKVSTRES